MSSLVTLGVLLRLAEAARRARSTEEGGGDASSGSVRNPFPVGEDAPAARAEFPLSERQGERSSGAENRIRQPILPSVGGRLAIGDNNVLFGSARYPFGGTGTDGGIKSAALQTTRIIKYVSPAIPVMSGGRAVLSEDVRIDFGLVPAGPEITDAEVRVLANGVAQRVLGATFSGSSGTAVWPKDSEIDPDAHYTAIARIAASPAEDSTPGKVKVVVPHAQLMSQASATDPGRKVGIVQLNNDDDDKNKVLDLEDSGPVKDENDLVEIGLDIDRQALVKAAVESRAKGQGPGMVTLSVTQGEDRVKLWLDPLRQYLVPRRNWQADEAGLDETRPDALPKRIWVEGIKASDKVGDVRVDLLYTEKLGRSFSAGVELTVLTADLSVDSDNTAGMGAPERTADEDRIEDVANDPAYPGKLVPVNDNDDDRDRVPDYADGYNLDKGTSDRAKVDDENILEKFVRIILEVPKPIDLAKATLRLQYPASDPLGVKITTGQIEPEIRYTLPITGPPNTGNLRIWKKDGSEKRDGRSCVPTPPATSQGDYVPPGVLMTPADVGITNDKRTVTLFMEAVAQSAQLAAERVVIEVDPDGTGPVTPIAMDAVRVTALRLRLTDIARPAGQQEIIGGGIAWISAERPGDPNPAMPRLRADIVPALPGHQAAWSMRTVYDRPEAGKADDEITLPGNDPHNPGAVETRPTAANGKPVAWDIEESINLLPGLAAGRESIHVFGGNATVRLQVDGPLNPIFSQDLEFELRGENPSMGVARAFIERVAGPSLWFTYAIAKHETDATSSGRRTFYNQFVPHDGRICTGRRGMPCVWLTAKDKGLPVFGDNIEGWGMMQLDRSSTAAGSTLVAEIWNWQANVISGVMILRDKVDQVAQHMGSLQQVCSKDSQGVLQGRGFPIGQRPQSQISTGAAQYVPPAGACGFGQLVNVVGGPVPIGNFPPGPTPTRIGRCPAFSDANIDDASIIKRYNSGNLVNWINGGWKFGSYDYLTAVCALVE